MHQASLAEHERQTTDVRWAHTTSQVLESDFQHNEGTQFRTVDVDCRTTSCAVVLEWPSRELAVSEWRRAMMQPTRANCGRQILVPERPPEVTGPILVTMLLDCSTWVETQS